MQTLNEKSNDRKWLLLLLIFLLFVLIGVGIWIDVSLNNPPDDPTPSPGVVQLDPNQGGYVALI